MKILERHDNLEIQSLTDFLTQMPKGLNKNSIARHLYLELGKRSFYDREYEYMMFGEEETISKYTYKSYTNPNIIICTTLSKQYKELLDGAGIEASISFDKLGHSFILYKDEEGIEHVTDLTRDLKNIQFGCSTSYFGRSTISREALRQMDINLGYITSARGYSNDYWIVLRDRLDKSNYSTQTKFEIVLRSLKEFGDLSKLGESELFSMYEKFVRYCGDNSFKALFTSRKASGSPEEYRVDLTTCKNRITYLLNRETLEFEKESEKELEEISK